MAKLNSSVCNFRGEIAVVYLKKSWYKSLNSSGINGEQSRNGRRPMLLLSMSAKFVQRFSQRSRCFS